MQSISVCMQCDFSWDLWKVDDCINWTRPMFPKENGFLCTMKFPILFLCWLFLQYSSQSCISWVTKHDDEGRRQGWKKECGLSHVWLLWPVSIHQHTESSSKASVSECVVKHRQKRCSYHWRWNRDCDEMMAEHITLLPAPGFGDFSHLNSWVFQAVRVSVGISPLSTMGQNHLPSPSLERFIYFRGRIEKEREERDRYLSSTGLNPQMAWP